MGHWGSLAGSNVYCVGTDSVNSCPKTGCWEKRGLILYTLTSRLQKQKARSNPYMVTCTPIGYFTLVLHNFLPLPPQCYVTFSAFGFLRFYLCYVNPNSVLLYQNTSLSVSLLVLLTTTLFSLWCLDTPRVKEHHLDPGVCISIASLHVQWFFFL
jgi:hypothetical protein